MVECKLPEYRLELNSPSKVWGDEWEYQIKSLHNEIVRSDGLFNDLETAEQWGRRALWCLSLGDK